MSNDTGPPSAAAETASPAGVVVAVSASAASPDSLAYLLAHLPPLDGIAVVLALQHPELLDAERLARALAPPGRALSRIRADALLEAGQVYLPDPGTIVTVEHHRFRVRPAEPPPEAGGTIDSLLVSLARDEDRYAIAVTLAGTNGDGTLGVKAIKEAGGLAFAEETEEARSGELAGSSSPAAIADAILPVARLAERLASAVGHLVRGRDGVFAPDSPDIAGALTSIATILRNKTGHDFHGYKPGTFLRRVQRRMQVLQTDQIQTYVESLRAKPDEAQNLFNDLLIGVTQFFRDAAEFEILQREVIPALFSGKTRSDQLRVWVIGCSTGEEAYSIAMLLREYMADRDDAPQIQIFATDLDGRALASARAGRYADDIARVLTPERLGRWFVKEGDTYCVVKELREMCIFSQHSIIKDAPFSRLDLVSCRNLLIYLEAELQSRVVPLFHFSLRPGGFLFLGNSENVSRHTSLFAPIESRSRIFRRLEGGSRVLPDFPFTAVDRRLVSAAPADRTRIAEATLARRAERFVERYAPAYVIVDESFTVLHFSGRTGRYIDPAGGAASLNLLQLAHPDLRLDLRAALAQAAEQGDTVQIDGLRVGANGQRLMVDLVVEPVQESGASPQNYIVLFKDGAVLRDPPDPAAAASAQTEYARRLEDELRTTKNRLQATIEELESTNEELKSSNEEYQSLNEELQSANEELETSKEELQSVNEELTTVNGELAHRVHELTRATSDLKNFLESTQIATVFLDNELRVTNSTPAVVDVFHLVESDIGRPIAHIKSRVAYDELQDDARRVLRTLATIEREIANPETGARYMVRVLPYRSVDNFIAGVVLTFVDITARQQAEAAMRVSEGQAKLLLAELQHRVRNTLAVMRSIVRRTAATSDTVDDYAAQLEGRIDAFARVQAAVTRDPAAGIDLEQLVSHELLAYAAHEGEQVRSIAGPPVRLRAKAAETFALAVHELATNAVKHGALSASNGRVAAAWRFDGAPDAEPTLVFDWTESGLDRPVAPPARRGFGSELIERTLSYELGGRAVLNFRPEGLHCRIVLPATDRIIASGRP